MTKDVFISYARNDYKDISGKEIPNNPISKIKEALNIAGLTYWFDEDGIGAGQEWSDLIPPAILNSTVFVFVSSKNSNEHKFTRSEVAIAHEYEKHIIPFRIDDTKYNPSIVVHLAGLEHISYGADPVKSCEKLVASIQSYIDDIKNKKKQEQEEMERQKRIQEIDKELKNQYEQKLSFDNMISERQQALSEVESQREEILLSIANLEKNKKMLNGSGRSATGFAVSEKMDKTESPISFRQILYALKNSGKKVRMIYGTVAFSLVACFLLLVIVNSHQKSTIRQQQSTMDSYIDDFNEIYELSSDIMCWRKTICNLSMDDYLLKRTFKVEHEEGDFIEFTSDIPFYKNSKSNYMVLSLDNFTYKSFVSNMPDHPIRYQFRNSGTSVVRLYVHAYQCANKNVRLNLITRDSIRLKINRISAKYPIKAYSKYSHYNNDNDLFVLDGLIERRFESDNWR